MKLAGQTRQVFSLIHVVTCFGECHPKTQALRSCYQRIKSTPRSHPLRIKQLGVQSRTTYEVVAAVDSRTHDYVCTVEELESLIERLGRQLRAVAIESDHAAVAPSDEDAEGRDEARGKTFAFLSDDFDCRQPTGEIDDI